MILDTLPQSYVHEVVAETGSTMDDVKAILDENEDPRRHHGYVLQALHQHNGKGKQGRRWESAKENLMFSMIVDQRHLQGREIAMLAALSVIDMINDTYDLPVRPTFKMVNDVLVGDRKLCGILVDKAYNTGGFVNLGVGLNTNHTPDLTQGAYQAISIRDAFESSVVIDNSATLNRFARRFEAHYQAMLNDCFHVWRGLGALSMGFNELTVRKLGGEVITGLYEGFHQDEYLLLNNAGLTELPVRELQILMQGQFQNHFWTARYL